MATAVTANSKTQTTANRSVPMHTVTDRFVPNVENDASYASGTGSGQVDEVWTSSATVADGVFVNLDLNALDQLDDDGVTIRSTINFANIKLIQVKNVTAGATGYLTVGGGTDAGSAADAWAGVTTAFLTDASIIALPTPNSATNDMSVFKWTSYVGGTVTGAGAADILCLGGVTATQTYEIIIVGVAT